MTLPKLHIRDLFWLMLVVILGLCWLLHWRALQLQLSDARNNAARLQSSSDTYEAMAKRAKDSDAEFRQFREQLDQDWRDALTKVDNDNQQRVLDEHRNIRSHREKEWTRLKTEASDSDETLIPRRLRATEGSAIRR